MTSDRFFASLPSSSVRTGMCDTTRHHAVPDDWTIVIVDIAGSTRAVAEGRYKDVNIVSSCAIAAVLNRIGRERVCYIYGGDGATFLIPASCKFGVASALYGTQEIVRRDFDLDMRAGMVDVAALTGQGLAVRVAKIETHSGVYQAALSGGGAAEAERWIKDPVLRGQYDIAALFPPAELAKMAPSFEGFECRWEPLRSRNGVNLSLLVVARTGSEAESAALYQFILDRIVEICGAETEWKPVSESQLDVSLNPLPLAGEAKVRCAGNTLSARVKYWAHITVLTWVGWYCFRFGKKAGSFDGRSYRQKTANNTDFMKFENALKIVMDISGEQKEKLETFLHDLYEAKRIFYGMHASNAAVMTCLVFSYEQDHFHFVDGADGGYTLAAKQLKAQIKADLLDDDHRVVNALR